MRAPATLVATLLAAAALLSPASALDGLPGGVGPGEHPILGNHQSESLSAYHADNDHELVGNAPDGAFVEVADATCPGTQTRISRMFYGSTTVINSLISSDPTADVCDETQEQGDDTATGGLIEYAWTAWPADDPDPTHAAGHRCSDQGLGTVPLPVEMGTIPDIDDPSAMTNVLYICKVTHHWDGYEMTLYAGDHPYATVGAFVRPANVCRKNFAYLTSVQKLRTWGCEWAPVSTFVCADAAGDATPAACTAACYAEHGCVSSGEYEYERLALKEMVAEVTLNAQDQNPPDIYLWKPDPTTLEGLPEEYNAVAGVSGTRDWYTDSELELRLNLFLSPSFPAAGKQSLDVTTEDAGDLLLSLSTDNFGPEPSTDPTQLVITAIFDDHAETPVNGVTGWESGVYAPEDRLEAFRYRSQGNANGAGTWALVAVDDCNAPQGRGAEVAAWQLHFVCEKQLFCKQSRPDAASGSGDPHMVGFRGQTFDYHGVPGAVFNVISTRETQVNASLAPEELDGLTYMASLAVLLGGGERLQVTAMPSLGALLVELDDVIVEADAASASGALSVEFLSETAVRVTSPELVVVCALHKEEFLDVQEVSLRKRPESIHGVLGNTANLAPEVDMVGEDSDYFVSNIWANDFKHSQFKRAVAPTSRGISKMLLPFAKRVEDAVEHDHDLLQLMSAKMANE